MSVAVLDLIKSILARPTKQTESNLHWVKADKPIEEMTNSERNDFANHLADEMLGSAIAKTPKTSLEKNVVDLIFDYLFRFRQAK